VPPILESGPTGQSYSKIQVTHLLKFGLGLLAFSSWLCAVRPVMSCYALLRPVQRKRLIFGSVCSGPGILPSRLLTMANRSALPLPAVPMRFLSPLIVERAAGKVECGSNKLALFRIFRSGEGV
jgi:hypothetical protein